MNSDVKSSSSNEEHIFEIEKSSNKWYVTKKLDLLDLQDMNNNSAKKIRNFDELNIDNDKYNAWNHSVIITGRNGSGWLYSAHSTNRKDYPILNVYPSSTYTNIRYIKFWH